MPTKRINKQNAQKSTWPTVRENVYLVIGIWFGFTLARYFVDFYNGQWPDESFIGFAIEHIEMFAAGGALSTGVIFLLQILRDRKVRKND
jgi:hypothetical protein